MVHCLSARGLQQEGAAHASIPLALMLVDHVGVLHGTRVIYLREAQLTRLGALGVWTVSKHSGFSPRPPHLFYWGREEEQMCFGPTLFFFSAVRSSGPICLRHACSARFRGAFLFVSGEWMNHLRMDEALSLFLVATWALLALADIRPRNACRR